MGKRKKLHMKQYVLNRKARRQQNRDEIRAMELLLGAEWWGHYFVKAVDVGGEGWLTSEKYYFNRQGRELTLKQVESINRLRGHGIGGGLPHKVTTPNNTHPRSPGKSAFNRF